MLFHLTWEIVDNSEEGAKRSLDLFSKWQPPEGTNFIGFYGNADGSGGVAIMEVDSIATLAKGTAPWTPWLRFMATPILPIEEASAVGNEAIAWREAN